MCTNRADVQISGHSGGDVLGRCGRCSLNTLSLNSILAIIAQKAILYHLFNTDVCLRSWLDLNINSIALAWPGLGSYL